MSLLFRIIISIAVFCGYFSPVFAGEKPLVFVSILPQHYFVQQIGGDRVSVEVMVQPGASPATYEPRPGQMAALSRARAYFSIGVPFENAWLGKITAANPGMTIVRTDAGIEKMPMATGHHHGETAEPAAHPEESPDPHIWLSPVLVKHQAGIIRDALITIDPVHEREYQANCETFFSGIDALDRELKGIFTGRQGLSFMVFHPSWGYFAAAYGLRQVPIEIEGKDPKPAQLKALIEYARAHRVQVVFVQPQFSAKSAKLVAREIGGRVAFVDPLAPNWPDNLRAAAAQFRSALQ